MGRLTIADIRIGRQIENGRNGKGTVSKVTPRTITVTFHNGNVVKNTYPTKDAYFYETDF